MPKIRHLAIKTKDPERLAKFYEEVFGMKCIHSEKSGARYMSDGYLTLAILRNRGEATPSGINHFGFQVDDLGDIEAKLAKWDEPMTERPSTRPFAEHRAMDPDGNLFDISVHGLTMWNMRPTGKPRPRKRPRNSRLDALCPLRAPLH